MLTSQIVASIGLGLDILGVLILFRFGFPQPSFDEGIKIVARDTEGHAEGVKRERRRYESLSTLAAFLIVAGFLLQIAAVWLR